MRPYLSYLERRPATKDLPYTYRKGEKRIRAKKVRQDGKRLIRQSQ